MKDIIATTSIGEGLDFACNLVSVSLSEVARQKPNLMKELLHYLTSYIVYRYAGEEELALECLKLLGEYTNNTPLFQQKQFWAQLIWVAEQMDVSKVEYEQHYSK